MQLIAWLWDLVRELAIVAAAIGVAKWSLDQHRDHSERKDREARLDMAEEQARAEHRAFNDRMLADIRARTEAREADARLISLKIDIHSLLHATRDPFLTFSEIRVGLAKEGGEAPTETLVRQALIALAGERVVSQMEQDRYFVAGDFEADDAGEATT